MTASRHLIKPPPDALDGEALRQWADAVVADMREWYGKPHLAQALLEAATERDRKDRLIRRREAKRAKSVLTPWPFVPEGDAS